MNTRIITDSTADLLPQWKEKVSVVPLTLNFGEEVYVDGISISHKAFYEKLVETDTLPTTSQATPGAFSAEFSKLSEGEEAVVVTLSSSLSGTYQSAMIAASEYNNIYVVDSCSAAIGGGILVALALEMAEKGMTAKQIAAALEEEKKKIVLIALVDTLEYLKKGGRVSKTLAFAGSILNIKPVIALDEGKIVMLGKARGSRQGNNLLVQQIEKAGGVDFSKPLLLGYTGLSDALLLKYIEDSKHLWAEGVEQVPYTTIGSVIGTHAGPGAVAVAFFKK